MWRSGMGAGILATALTAGCADGTSTEGAPPPAATASPAPRASAGAGLSVQDVDVEVRDDLQRVFAAAGVVGTFVLLDAEERRLTVVDRVRAETPAVPASTFKIPYSLIALETGAVRDVDEVVPYGGRPQPFPQWERDMSMREALPASNAAIFQELARRIGLQQEQAWLDRLDYGNKRIGSAVDRFWLDGPLKISPVEQTFFLHRFASGALPVADAHLDAVTDLLAVPGERSAALFGKTGLIFQSNPQLGWWVGWVKQPAGRLYTFALTMDIDEDSEAGQRIPLGQHLLRELGALP